MLVLILAGGSGARLWPLSKQALPKQFLRLSGSHSFLQKTLLRFLHTYSVSDLFILTQKEYHELVLEHVCALDERFAAQIILEPAKKNTALALVYAAQYLQERGLLLPGTCFAAVPSDQLISPESTFLHALRQAEEEAKQGAIITFGIPPYKPETGYGYIKAAPSSATCTSVERFIEKPPLHLAQEFLLSGGYYWNAGIFVFEVSHFFQQLALHCPALTPAENLAQLHHAYDTLPTLSIDYALIEKCTELKVIPLHVSWSDIGSWDSLYAALEKDDHANVKIGNIDSVDTKNCLIIGGKKLISTVGLEEMIIVETEEVLFLGKRKS